MPGELPLPPHFAPERAGEVWRVPYTERAAEAALWATEHGVAVASEDAFRLCLVVIDAQNTFCMPDSELFVAGRSGTAAVDDNRQLCGFIYRNLAAITRIVPTLDTHEAAQIFHPAFLVDERGLHPQPYTLVSAEDVEAGRWRVSPAVARSLGLDEDYAQRHLRHYTRALERSGKYRLTVWPYHAMLGGIGHALASLVEEAVFFHGAARSSPPDLRLKGRHPLVEHYSLLGPEVTHDADGRVLVEPDAALLAELHAYDAVVVAGQAKSHCVAWTLDDLVSGAADPDLLRRVYLLEDCTSPIVVAGAVDYTEEADAAFARFAGAGMHIVRSSDPIAGWPGLERLETARATVS